MYYVGRGNEAYIAEKPTYIAKNAQWMHNLVYTLHHVTLYTQNNDHISASMIPAATICGAYNRY